MCERAVDHGAGDDTAPERKRTEGARGGGVENMMYHMANARQKRTVQYPQGPAPARSPPRRKEMTILAQHARQHPSGRPLGAPGQAERRSRRGSAHGSTSVAAAGCSMLPGDDAVRWEMGERAISRAHQISPRWKR